MPASVASRALISSVMSAAMRPTLPSAAPALTRTDLGSPFPLFPPGTDHGSPMAIGGMGRARPAPGQSTGRRAESAGSRRPPDRAARQNPRTRPAETAGRVVRRRSVHRGRCPRCWPGSPSGFPPMRPRVAGRSSRPEYRMPPVPVSPVPRVSRTRLRIPRPLAAGRGWAPGKAGGWERTGGTWDAWPAQHGQPRNRAGRVCRPTTAEATSSGGNIGVQAAIMRKQCYAKKTTLQPGNSPQQALRSAATGPAA